MFDEEKAAAALSFMRHLKHTKGKWAGVPFSILPWQEKLVRDLFGTVNESGFRQYRTAYVEVPRKQGKALALETPIPTPTGWSTMGELLPGNQVFDETGRPVTVVAVGPIEHGRPCFEVAFSDGERIVADAEHEWYTEAKRTGRPHGKRWRPSDHIRTTAVIAATLHAWPKAIGVPEWNHRIPLAHALELPEASLPIPPYTLGAWLGDGSRHGAKLTCADADRQILDEIESEGIRVAPYQRMEWSLGVDPTRCQADRHLTLQSRLRRFGLLQNKHIPDAYQRASRSQRLSLLQGLMDTDGHAGTDGQCEFTTTTPALAEGMSELLTGLGFKHTVRAGIATLNGRSIGPKWRIQFCGDPARPPFRLARKVARLRTSKGRALRRQIVGCEPVASVAVRCIQVDGPSRLYLAGRKMVPTHNSECAAAIALKLLFADGEAGGEVYGAAKDRDQASIVFNVAAQMVRQSPVLSSRAKVIDSSKRIIVTKGRSAGSVYRAIPADAAGSHGFNASAVVVDEVHVQPNRELWDVLGTSTGARTQPLMVGLTTAGFDRESLCWELHEHARQVIEGVLEDPTFYGLIYSAPEDADWKDPAVWAAANPSLGHTVPVEYFEAECRKAQQMPAYENTFRRLHLNQWTTQDSRWIPIDRWDASKGTIDPAKLKSRPCFAGLDLSSTTDLTALAMVFPPPREDGDFQAMFHFWIPEDRLQDRIRRDRVPYDQWVRDGHVTATPGNVVDYAVIRKEFGLLGQEFGAWREVGYDPWNATQLAIELQDDGFDMVPIRQGFASLSAPTKELERLVLERRLRHGGNPVIRWMVNNVQVRQDAAGNLKPDKERSRDRIDGVVALVMALDRASRHRSSTYEDNRLFIL